MKMLLDRNVKAKKNAVKRSKAENELKKRIKQGIQLGMCALISTSMACSQHDAEAPAGETAGSVKSPQQVQESETTKGGQH